MAGLNKPTTNLISARAFDTNHNVSAQKLFMDDCKMPPNLSIKCISKYIACSHSCDQSVGFTNEFVIILRCNEFFSIGHTYVNNKRIDCYKNEFQMISISFRLHSI